MSPSQTHTKEHRLPSSRATVLIVDDDSSILEMCQHTLKKYRVIQAVTCEEAIRQYEREQVDLVLSDIMMPGGSGLDLLRDIKALDPNATVIIMTGFSDRDIILQALKDDADDFISKPLNILQLKTSIKKALEKKVLKEELALIKRSDALKNDFLSLISHKLRTPITGISLFLQNLRNGMYNFDDQMFRQGVKMANDEALYLGHLVEDLLKFSHAMVHGVGMDRQPGNLNELVAEVLNKCQEIHCNVDIDLEIADDSVPPVHFDAPKISFALLQVIDNALKFSGKEGHVSLKVAAQGDSVYIVVSDTGIGIPSSEIPKVFEKFYQIDPDRTGQIRGFGLGLFYARDFIRQHGGSISLNSQPGLGTTVTICLPITSEE